MIIYPCAKINLALDILGKDKKSGYHFINTIFHKINLFDEIEIKQSKDWKFEFWTDKDYIDIKEIDFQKNIFHKLLNSLDLLPKKKYFLKIKKNIPIAMGMGGASSDVAEFMKFLKIKKNVAKSVGMDVANFFYKEKTTFGENFGEKITSIKKFEIKKIALFIPKEKMKTKDAYKKIDLKKCGKNQKKTEKIINGNFDKKFFHNDFLTIDKLTKIKNLLGNEFFLTGSGAGFFSVSNFDDIKGFEKIIV